MTFGGYTCANCKKRFKGKPKYSTTINDKDGYYIRNKRISYCSEKCFRESE